MLDPWSWEQEGPNCFENNHPVKQNLLGFSWCPLSCSWAPLRRMSVPSSHHQSDTCNTGKIDPPTPAFSSYNILHDKVSPLCNKSSIISVCPICAASARGVSPYPLRGSGSAPERSSSITRSFLPSLAASCRAVLSWTHRRFTLAPEFINKEAIWYESCLIAVRQ